MNQHRRQGRLGRAAVVLLASALLGSACGITADESPEVIAADDIPEDLLDPNPPTSTTLPGATASVIIYLVERSDEATRLVAVTREVEDPTRPGERIGALLQPTSESEKEDGLTSSIPTDTVLLGTPQLDPATQVLTLDFSEELFDVEGTELAQAFAQIVYTVTEHEGVRRVSFLVEGEPQRAPNADGVEQAGPVSIADYRTLSPLPRS